MSIVRLQVNGVSHELDIDPSTPLLYVVRNDLELRGPRFACGLGQCGACTVIINGAPIRSCVMPVSLIAYPTCTDSHPTTGFRVRQAAIGARCTAE